MKSSSSTAPVTVPRTQIDTPPAQNPRGNSRTVTRGSTRNAEPGHELANLGRAPALASTSTVAPPRNAVLRPATANLAAVTPSQLEGGQPANAQPNLRQRLGRYANSAGQNLQHSVLDPMQTSLGNAGHFVAHQGARAGRNTVQTVRTTASDTRSNLPSLQSLGAAVGHGVQQAITCGVPTFAREQVYIHANHVAMELISRTSPWAAVGVQAAISCATVAAHVYLRQPRMDKLGPDSTVAVRGHFGLSEDQWAAKTPAEQHDLRTQHETDSRNVTRNQVLAESAFLVMGGLSAALGDGSLAPRIVATQLRNLTYALSRETGNASLSFTTKDGDAGTHGINAEHMQTMGARYTGTTLAMGYVQDMLIKQMLPEGFTVSGPNIHDETGAPLHGDALKTAALIVSGARALANTVIEFGDAKDGKGFDMAQSGMAQKLQTTIKDAFPMKDYERLLDHSVARMSWNNSANALQLAVQQIGQLAGKGHVPPDVAEFLGNAASAIGFGASYRMVNQTYQAHGKVRGAPVPDDLEAGRAE